MLRFGEDHSKPGRIVIGQREVDLTVTDQRGKPT